MSVTISAYKQCLIRLYPQLFGWRDHVLCTFFCGFLFAHSGVQHILCCVIVLFVFFLCTLCCQFLWIVILCIAPLVFLTFTALRGKLEYIKDTSILTWYYLFLWNHFNAFNNMCSTKNIEFKDICFHRDAQLWPVMEKSVVPRETYRHCPSHRKTLWH